ncbi:MAG: hypothetical protein IPJ00_13050 [Saprospirales bacterium]|nr:hypothetical protein [Saprospirales bacterium]
MTEESETSSNHPGRSPGLQTSAGGSVNYTGTIRHRVTLYDWSLSPAIGGITNDGSNSRTVHFRLGLPSFASPLQMPGK